MDKAKFNKYAKLGLIGLASILIAPFVFLMVQGIVGVAVAVVLVAVLNALAPAAAALLTAVKFKAVKYVVDKAPVEALQNRVTQMWEGLEKDAEDIKQQKTSVEMLKHQCEKTAREFPEEAENLRKRLDIREKALAMRVELFKRAKAGVEAFARNVKKAEMFYEIDCRDAEIGGNDRPSQMQNFITDKAFEAIERKAAEARAAVSMQAEGIDASPSAPPVHAITYGADNTVQLGNILDVQATVRRVEQAA